MDLYICIGERGNKCHIHQGEALTAEGHTAAFDETTPSVMDGHVEGLFVIWGLLLSGIGAYEIYQTLITNKKAYRSAVKCANDAKEDTCEYCGNVYVIGTCHECPHCGAPLRPQNVETEQPVADAAK